MKVWVVQYHDDSWGAQQSSDEILGVYTTEEAASKRADEFEESNYCHEDDTVSVEEYELDEPVKTMSETLFEERA